MKVLVVDDSGVLRSQIKRALRTSDIEIAGSAENGQAALDFVKANEVDVITLDLEMPVLNGIETLKALRDIKTKAKVIVFAAQTSRGAKTTMEALSLGAIDVVTKPDSVGSLDEATEKIGEDLIPKIRQIVPGILKVPSVDPAPAPTSQVPDTPKKEWTKKELSLFRPEIIVVGSSTGGPIALESLLKGISTPLPVPIVIAQHMPAMFTKALAERLGSVIGYPCVEAAQGVPLSTESIFIAPGDYHLRIAMHGDRAQFSLSQGPKRNSVRPCVDYLFETAAEFFGKKTMGFILTGMGEDGKDGCRAIKDAGGGVMIQDKESSVVWGMPGAVHREGAFDKMSSLDDCRAQLADLLVRQKAA